MTEKDILDLIKRDDRMMSVLRIAEKLDLPDWVIGAGFVRNKVWNYLHGHEEATDDTDIDLVYYDPDRNDQKADEGLTEKLKKETGMNWEIVNEIYAHTWTNSAPYSSAEDALAHWSETATGIGVKLKNSKLKLIAPHGIKDLVELIVRPTMNTTKGIETVRERARSKRWAEKWPKLNFNMLN